MGNAIHAECPKCGTSATGMRSVRELFSTRRNAQEEVIPQSWCKSCRNGKKGKSPKAKSAKPKTKALASTKLKERKGSPAVPVMPTNAKKRGANTVTKSGSATPKKSKKEKPVSTSAPSTSALSSSGSETAPSIKTLYKQHYPNDKASRGTRFMEAKLVRKGVLPVQSKAVEEKGSVDFI
jgi:hypothetical protein